MTRMCLKEKEEALPIDVPVSVHTCEERFLPTLHDNTDIPLDMPQLSKVCKDTESCESYRGFLIAPLPINTRKSCTFCTASR